jgi:PKD repeat protein
MAPQLSQTSKAYIYTLTLNSGIYTFTAQAEGYEAQTLTEVEIVSGNYTFDFALEPLTATLTGQVSEAVTLLPIHGAQMKLHSGPSTLTDESGYYTFTLTTGTYTVTAEAEGYLSQSQVADIISGTATLDFALEPYVCAPPDILSVNISITGLSVSFSPSISSTSPLSYLWDFGDGMTSTLEAPMHTYSNYDRFTATLNVMNDCGTDTWSGDIALLRSAYLPIIFNPTP